MRDVRDSSREGYIARYFFLSPREEKTGRGGPFGVPRGEGGGGRRVGGDFPKRLKEGKRKSVLSTALLSLARARARPPRVSTAERGPRKEREVGGGIY